MIDWKATSASGCLVLSVLAAGCTTSATSTVPPTPALTVSSAPTTPPPVATTVAPTTTTLVAPTSTAPDIAATSTAPKPTTERSTTTVKPTTTLPPLPSCTTDQTVKLASAKPPYQQSAALVQQRLIDLGYSPGPIDGFIGPKTMAALEAWSGDIGMDTLPWNETDDSIDHEVLVLLDVSCPA